MCMHTAYIYVFIHTYVCMSTHIYIYIYIRLTLCGIKEMFPRCSSAATIENKSFCCFALNPNVMSACFNSSRPSASFTAQARERKTNKKAKGIQKNIRTS